jgi:hypothetical protein
VPLTQIHVEAGEGGEAAAAAAAKKPSLIRAAPGPDWSRYVARALKVTTDVFGPHGPPTFD